jgi:hypothetical protein
MSLAPKPPVPPLPPAAPVPPEPEEPIRDSFAKFASSVAPLLKNDLPLIRAADTQFGQDYQKE